MTNTIDVGADGRFTAFVVVAFRPIVVWMMARRLGKEVREPRAIVEGSDGMGAGPDSS